MTRSQHTRLQIDIVIPCDGRDTATVIDDVTRDLTWRHDADHVEVTEVTL